MLSVLRKIDIWRLSILLNERTHLAYLSRLPPGSFSCMLFPHISVLFILQFSSHAFSSAIYPDIRFAKQIYAANRRDVGDIHIAGMCKPINQLPVPLIRTHTAQNDKALQGLIKLLFIPRKLFIDIYLNVIRNVLHMQHMENIAAIFEHIQTSNELDLYCFYLAGANSGICFCYYKSFNTLYNNNNNL